VLKKRNKLAAARYRKRRVDQTNELIEKVDQLEKEKQGLQKKIEDIDTRKTKHIKVDNMAVIKKQYYKEKLKMKAEQFKAKGATKLKSHKEMMKVIRDMRDI